MSEFKYYTPLIEELFIGYLGELRYKDPTWESYTISNGGLLDFIIQQLYNQKDGEFRTKYLDQADIESLGWVDQNDESMGQNSGYLFKGFLFPGTKSPLVLKFWDNNKRINISAVGWGNLFDGECKSINELRIIQKLLGISQTTDL